MYNELYKYIEFYCRDEIYILFSIIFKIITLKLMYKIIVNVNNKY